MKPKPAGLYAITPDEPNTAVLLRKVGEVLQSTPSMLQYRNKTADTALRREQALALAGLCRAAGVPLIINDDLALALEVDADGVHLGAEDGDLASARRSLGADKLLGASCYDRLDLAVAAYRAGADHLAFGAVFSSTTKPDTVRAPLTLFAEARRSVPLPLVAIGGITMQNAAEVFAAGADAVAVISALFEAEDIPARAAGFARIYQQLRMQK